MTIGGVDGPVPDGTMAAVRSVQPPLPIAIVAARYAPAIGGVELHVQRLAEGLVERGVAVEALVTDPTSTYPPLEQRNGVLVRRFPALHGDSVYFVSPRLLRWVWREGHRYRLFHGHGYHTLMPLIGAIGARRSGAPLAVTPHYHGTGHTRFRSLLHVPYRPAGAWALRSAARVFANSEAEMAWLQRDFGDLPLQLVPNGVDLPEPEAGPGGEAPAEAVGSRVDTGASGLEDSASGAALGILPARAPGERTILSVGRLETYKGVDRIVSALPSLPAAWHLTIVGDGPQAGAIRQRAESLGVADRLRLRGHVSADELHAWYGTADVYVTVSREESFGLTVLEAAAAGAPVLASDIAAHREVTRYAGPGRIRLVDPDADGTSLAAKIQEAARAGRSDDRTGWQLPTWDALVDSVLAAYEEILGGPLV